MPPALRGRRVGRAAGAQVETAAPRRRQQYQLLKLIVGLVVGVVSAVLWIFAVAALVAAGLWARSTLVSAGRRRAVRPSSSAKELTGAPGEDPVAVEMRRITEQLREQGRR